MSEVTKEFNPKLSADYLNDMLDNMSTEIEKIFPLVPGLKPMDVGFTVKRILNFIDFKRGLKVSAPPIELYSLSVNYEGAIYIFRLEVGYRDDSKSHEVYGFDKEKDKIVHLS